MIAFKDISAGYGPCNVVRGVSASASKGQVIGLIGPNGGGKSTLLKTLAGLHTPSAGRVEIDGKDVSALPARTRAKSIAYLAQDRETAWAMSARDVVALGRAPYRGALGRISAEGEAAITRALQKTDSTGLAVRAASTLSGGELARVLLARALAVEAPVLIADEPASNLDPAYALKMMHILRAEAGQGRTVIVALHDLALASQFCDRIWLMHHGELLAQGSPDTVLTADTLRQSFGITPPPGGFTLPALSEPSP